MSNIFHLFKRRINVSDESLRLSSIVENSQQLTLPFGAPHILYLLIGGTDATNEEFLYFVSKKCIAVFFDLRFSPRLDFVAATRQKAFIKLKEVGLNYYDVYGRLGISSPATAVDDRFEILKNIVAAAEETLKQGEPCLMMFDRQSLASEYKKSMGDYFEIREIDGKYISDAVSDLLKIQM